MPHLCTIIVLKMGLVIVPIIWIQNFAQLSAQINDMRVVDAKVFRILEPLKVSCLPSMLYHELSASDEWKGNPARFSECSADRNAHHHLVHKCCCKYKADHHLFTLAEVVN